MGVAAVLLRDDHPAAGPTHRVILSGGATSPSPNNANCNLIEQDGTPKPAYYALQNAYRLVHVSASYDKLYFTPGETMRIGLYLSPANPVARRRHDPV